MTQPTDDGAYENYVPPQPPLPEQHAAGGERLPVPDGSGATVPARRAPASLLAAVPYEPFAIASTICTAIWLMTDPGGYFWPMWVMLGTGIPILVALVGRSR